MDRKQVSTGIFSGTVCLMMGLVFGYIAGANMVPGMRLTGADMDALRMTLSDSGNIAAREQQKNERYAEQMDVIAEREAILAEAEEHLATLRDYQYARRTSAPEIGVVTFFDTQDIPCPSGDIEGNYTTEDWRDMSDSLRDFITTRNNMSQMDVMRLQYELMQLNLQQEVTSKTADKTNQGVQTLFKNQ